MGGIFLMSKHARMSPSDSVRWLQCIFALFADDILRRLNDGILPDRDTEAARVGRMGHEWSAFMIAMILEPHNNPQAHLSEFMGDFKSPPSCVSWLEAQMVEIKNAEFVEACEEYVATCVSLWERWKHEPGARFGIERRVELWYEPGSYGTIDFWVYTGTIDRTLHVKDLKTGKRIVHVEGNSQLGIYGIALMDEIRLFCPVDHLIPGIFQPEQALSFIDADPISKHAMDGLRDECMRVAAMSQWETWGFVPYPRPSAKACDWCQHYARCPAHIDKEENDSGAVPELVSDDALNVFYTSIPDREKQIGKVKAEVEGRLEDFPMWKREAATGGRYAFISSDESAVAKKAAKIIGVSEGGMWTPRQLASFSTMKGLVKGKAAVKAPILKKLKALVEFVPHKDVIVRASDEEQAIAEEAADSRRLAAANKMFDD